MEREITDLRIAKNKHLDLETGNEMQGGLDHAVLCCSRHPLSAILAPRGVTDAERLSAPACDRFLVLRLARGSSTC